MPIDLNKAIEYGLLLEAAYKIDPHELHNMQGEKIGPEFDQYQRGYEVVSSLYSIDITFKEPQENEVVPGRVSFGFVCKDAQNNFVVIIRGTVGFPEWVGNLYAKHAPFLEDRAELGRVHSGFKYGYRQLNAKTSYIDSIFAVRMLEGYHADQIASLTICGHSLGSAYATMLALDVALETEHRPDVYLFASPRTGDQKFADAYNARVPNTYRIVNTSDIVPTVPKLGFKHVSTPISLDPTGVRHDELCWHSMRTHLFLLSQQGQVQKAQELADRCKL